MEEKPKETKLKPPEKQNELAKERKLAKHPICKMTTVHFTRYVPTFRGMDAKAYGPFYAKQIATIPEADAHTLIRQGKALPWTVTATARPPPTHVAKEELRRQAEEAFKKLMTAVKGDDYAGITDALETLRELCAKARSA